jgi:hypothetical protein
LFGECVEPASGTFLVGGNLGVLPVALEQSHLLKTTERAIEGTVGGQETPVGNVNEMLRDRVAVEFVNASASELHGGREQRTLERHQRARLPSHRRIISRYMLMASIEIRPPPLGHS